MNDKEAEEWGIIALYIIKNNNYNSINNFVQVGLRKITANSSHGNVAGLEGNSPYNTATNNAILLGKIVIFDQLCNCV